MAPEGSDLATTLESSLRDGVSVLARAAEQMGAHWFSVGLADRDGSIRIVSSWPDSNRPGGDEVRAGSDMLAALEASGGLEYAGTTIGGFLNRTAGLPASSLLLFRWPEPRLKVIVAFGFASAQPGVAIPHEAALALRLAAIAFWHASEIRRLRRDLVVVSDRLGRRKLVERAKGMLQAKHGWSEPQAYEHLRKLSRQRRRTMADMAEDLMRALHGT